MATAVASTRIIYKSIKDSHENGNGRGHKNGGGNQYCTGGLRKNKTCFLTNGERVLEKTKRATTHETHAKVLKTHVKIATAAAIRANSL